MYRVRPKQVGECRRMYRVRPKWRKWPFWRVLEFAKLANFWRVLEFDKFAGEWPLLNNFTLFAIIDRQMIIYKGNLHYKLLTKSCLGKKCQRALSWAPPVLNIEQTGHFEEKMLFLYCKLLTYFNTLCKWTQSNVCLHPRV
jgi:hypothetical protein